jgi:hypothetical protein
VRLRSIIHVAGPRGVGKTALIEGLLRAEVALATCARGERDPKQRGGRESASRVRKAERRLASRFRSRANKAGWRMMPSHTCRSYGFTLTDGKRGLWMKMWRRTGGKSVRLYSPRHRSPRESSSVLWHSPQKTYI